MRRWKHLTVLAALSLATCTSGCSGTPSLPNLTLPPPPEAGQTDALDQPDSANTTTTSALQAILTPQDLVVGTPTEIYTRVARGVLTCWFGAEGPLKSQYIYHADAEPASRGGRSEIKIMTRDTTTADDPRALRAYRVLIQPSGNQAKIEVENTRLPEPLALRLKSDVERWARDEPGCGEGPVTAGWNADSALAPAGKTPPGKTSTSKTKKP
jgi:hypothetical protein